jgi:hypothetical protein
VAKNRMIINDEDTFLSLRAFAVRRCMGQLSGVHDVYFLVNAAAHLLFINDAARRQPGIQTPVPAASLGQDHT